MVLIFILVCILPAYAQQKVSKEQEIIERQVAIILGDDKEKSQKAESELLESIRTNPKAFSVALSEYISIPNAKVRALIARLLGRAKYVQVIPELFLLAVHDIDPSVRDAAGEAIFAIGPVGLSEMRLLSDNDEPTIRERFQGLIAQALDKLANLNIPIEDVNLSIDKTVFHKSYINAYLVAQFPDIALRVFAKIVSDAKETKGRKTAALLWMSRLPPDKALPVMADLSRLVSGKESRKVHVCSMLYLASKLKVPLEKDVLAQYMSAYTADILGLSKIQADLHIDLGRVILGEEKLIYDFFQIAPSASATALSNQWAKEKSLNAKVRILVALSSLRHDSALQAIMKAFDGERSVMLRTLSIRALAPHKSYKSTRVLMDAIHDHPYVAEGAFRLLPQIVLLESRAFMQKLLAVPYEKLDKAQRADLINKIDEWWRSNKNMYLDGL